jgi:hypothetical protein
MDLHHKLSKVHSEQLLALNPALSHHQAFTAAESISLLMSLSQGSFPVKKSKAEHSLLAREVQNDLGLSYDPVKNQLSTYLIYLPTSPSSTFLTKRFVNASQLHSLIQKRSIESNLSLENMPIRLPTGLVKRNTFVLQNSLDFITLTTRNATTGQSGVLLYTRSTDAEQSWSHFLIHTVEEAWLAVCRIFKKLGIALHKVYEAFLDFIRWKEITHTVSFLALFYRKLAPLSLFGLNIVRKKYLESLQIMKKKTDKTFLHTLKKLGVSNLNYDSAFSKAHQVKNETLGTDELSSPFDADAKTHFIHDRIVNNMPQIEYDIENKTLFERMGDILKEGATSITESVDRDALKNIFANKLAFKSGTSLAKMGLAKLMNLLRSLTLGSEQVLGNLYAAFMQLVPIYWNIAESIMMLPLKIPFVYEWLKAKFE